jgi:hypothetical protein
VTLASIAASVRADAGEGRRISIDGLSPHDRETITLLFEILGWQVVTAGLARLTMPRFTVPRLSISGSDGIIHVASDDPDLVPRLAATGLDRLVLPLNLAALEQLAFLAG